MPEAPLHELFAELLAEAEAVQAGFRERVGQGAEVEGLPSSFLRAIYSQIRGTRRANTDLGSEHDLLPGYFVIHAEELPAALEALKQHPAYEPGVLPFLGNCSSDYYCVAPSGESEEILSLAHDDPDRVLVHRSAEDFLRTNLRCYREKVYFLDEDEYLDYDYEAYSEIGRQLNPGVEYWIDEEEEEA